MTADNDVVDLVAICGVGYVMGLMDYNGSKPAMEVVADRYSIRTKW